MKKTTFTEKQLGSLYNFYANELNGNAYFEENGLYYLEDNQSGMQEIGTLEDIIEEFIFLQTEYNKEKNRIKNANACYSGGGIYIYYGQLENGLFFRACDEWEEIEICNADTSTEEADYYEFYESHTVETLADESYKMFFNNMISWIKENRPDGNYQIHELENRIIK